MKNFISFLLLYSTIMFINNYASDKFYFIIRVDDIMSRNTSYQPRSIVPFLEAIEKRNARITWLVIPHRLTEDVNKNGILKNELIESVNRGHEIGQHGYNHICSKCGHSSHEMYCTTFNYPFSNYEQTKIVNEGLEILYDSLGIIPKLFVSPGHNEDDMTYRVLSETGFDFISTTNVNKSYLYENLFNLAAHREFTWALTNANYKNNLNAALSDIKIKKENDGYYCLLLHDPFIRSGYESGIVINWMGELLDSLNSTYSGEITYVTLSSAAEKFLHPTSFERESPKTAYTSQLRNYPNPFNTSTIIEFQIPAADFVIIEIFDILGREVAKLLNSPMQAGKHKIEFSGNDDRKKLSSGIYLCRLKTSRQIITYKMILME